MALSDRKIGEHKVPARVSQSLAESGEREGLTGSSSDENIEVCISVPLLEAGHIAEVRHGGMMVRQHLRREIRAERIVMFGIELRVGDGRPAERLPCEGSGFDARADGEELHSFHALPE
jgi:hypothetical protein